MLSNLNSGCNLNKLLFHSWLSWPNLFFRYINNFFFIFYLNRMKICEITHVNSKMISNKMSERFSFLSLLLKRWSSYQSIEIKGWKHKDVFKRWKLSVGSEIKNTIGRHCWPVDSSFSTTISPPTFHGGPDH